MINSASVSRQHSGHYQTSVPRVDFNLIGLRLKMERKSLGLSQSEVSELLGVSERTVGRYERLGIRDLAVLDQVCSKYGILLPDLISTHDNYEWILAAIKRLGPQAVTVLSVLCNSIEANREVQS
ncbi:MAG: helix-turn-helix transcriptional regulator [Candidatus Thiodiazotropha sp.]